MPPQKPYTCWAKKSYEDFKRHSPPKIPPGIIFLFRVKSENELSSWHITSIERDMYINSFLPEDDKDRRSCKMILNILDCDSLWIMHPMDNSINVLVSETSIIEWYKDHKYYLQDPYLSTKTKASQKTWNAHLETECKAFHKNGFMQNLYNSSEIREFISIETFLHSKQYYCRFFTKTNRFVLATKLLNGMPVIQYFIKAMIKKFTSNLHWQPGINTEN